MNTSDTPTEIHQVPSEENVARILSKEWFVKDKLLSVAFALDAGETYLSVNRPAIDTYDSDVSAFVKKHSSYAFDSDSYKRALLNVGDVRSIKVEVGATQMMTDVEVEPRDAHTKSHAGIFTRFQNVNIKKGQILKAGPIAEEISADTVLLEVRKELLALSTVEDCNFK